MSIDHVRDQIEEAREEFQEKKHKKLTIWKHETPFQFDRRKKHHRQRVEKLDDLIKRLRNRAQFLAKKKEERKDKRQDARENPYNKSSENIVNFDGRPCVEKAAYWLYKSRKAGWNGGLNSGYRTPAYSEQLCYNMCGAPSCSGTCAGTSSNHTKKDYPGPAVDVSDYTNFERIQYEIGSPFRNDLPYDPVHFSLSGK